VIGLYELLGNPATQLIEPTGPLVLWQDNSSNKTYIHNFIIWSFDEAISIIKLTNIQ
jgi:hypothetical protein